MSTLSNSHFIFVSILFSFAFLSINVFDHLIFGLFIYESTTLQSSVYCTFFSEMGLIVTLQPRRFMRWNESSAFLFYAHHHFRFMYAIHIQPL